MGDPVPGFVVRLNRAIEGHPIARVAASAGVDRKTLKDLLAGRVKHGPYLATVEAIARAIGVDPGWLAYGDPGGG